MHYNYFRDYDPKTGRYIEPDPIGSLGEPVDSSPENNNLYVYVENNPLVSVDPLGLELISLQEGQKIVKEATTWLGVPYDPKGDSRAGIDCSHLVWRVYDGAGFPYPYRHTPAFPPKGKFGKVAIPQEGDVVLFSGHMGIYTNKKVISAQSGEGRVMEGELKWFGKIKGYYRYDKCK